MFRNVYIDGEIIFSELMSYMFPYWVTVQCISKKKIVETIWDMVKGTHTISLRLMELL